MSLESLLNHSCDIYHLQKGEASPGYGLAASPTFSYQEEPDIAGQSCHFGIESRSVTVTQEAPANIMEAKIKLTLPIDADVRLNDKIVDCSTGLAYTAEQPVNIRGHHQFVYIKREGAQKSL